MPATSAEEGRGKRPRPHSEAGDPRKVRKESGPHSERGKKGRAETSGSYDLERGNVLFRTRSKKRFGKRDSVCERLRNRKSVTRGLKPIPAEKKKGCLLAEEGAPPRKRTNHSLSLALKGKTARREDCGDR